MARKSKNFDTGKFVLQQGQNKFAKNGTFIQQGTHFTGYARKQLGVEDGFDVGKYYGSYPIYAFLFNLYNSGEVTKFDTVPFDVVAGKVNDYVRSMTGDFFEETENLAWLEVNEVFFHYLFLNDYLYVEYVSDEDKFYLYYKGNLSNLDKDADLKGRKKENYFVDVMTGDNVYFAKPSEALVRCSWNGIPDNRFFKWFRLAYDLEAKTRVIDRQFLFWNKRISLDLINNDHISQTDLDLLEKELVNLSVCFHNKQESGFISYVPLTVSTQEISTAQAIMYQKFDREAGTTGLVPNLNAKQERLIVAEAHTSMDKQIDELRRRLNQLKLMCKRMEEKGWPSLNFVTNTAENLGLVVASTPPAGENVSKKEDSLNNNV